MIVAVCSGKGARGKITVPVSLARVSDPDVRPLH
jgi:MinD superfamily P-loop ATPase